MMVVGALIIDTTDNVSNYIARYMSNGVAAFIRYDARPPGGAWKRLQPDEAKAIGDAGLELGVVYETAGNHDDYFSYSMGKADAEYTRFRAASRGQPDGSCVYFAVDYDAGQSALLHRIIPYFRAINEAFGGAGPKLKIGAYASGYVCSTLKRLELIDYCWVTCSLGFNGSRAAVEGGDYDLWQQHCDSKLIGRDADFNLARVADWGQYRPFAGTTSPNPPELVSLISPADIPWSYRGLASWYADDTNASMKPVDNRTDMTAAMWKLPFGTRVKVTRISTGASVVVTIQDRGPAKHLGRLIDLRPAAARELGIIDAGLAEVTVEEYA